ncbi:Sugar lactone lactonase YvrE [Amycolatopsis xylanica]|uniref:Sugar lactone lactonase YvrE n=1 Tax=Amycolatopsis xylanica TaxID=589385 RepID=A0A1H3RJS9_9PSEU|nr:SMP-30/gluconolactonase/LRE family protein [Amycolatopsis xylanica]SDZ26012.1 Sugar lactone lactonase YvrE [Amycolatopsis xylanica]
MRFRNRLALPALLAVAIGGLLAGPAQAHPAQDVEVTAPSLYPEGVAWDPTRRTYLVGSVRFGTVAVVQPGKTVRTLVSDPAMVSTFGISVDAAHSRLLVTYADLGLGERSSPATTNHQSGLGIFDLHTGQRISLVDLAGSDGEHAANDVAVDARGNAYVTDTVGDTLFRVDPRGRITARVTNPGFAAPGFGLNGVVWHPDGFALTVVYSTGKLFKVDMDTGKADEVALDQPVLGGDGLVLRRDGSLVAVTNSLGAPGVNGVRVLTSGDHWRTARQSPVTPWTGGAPTTAAASPFGTAVLTGHLEALTAGDTSVRTFGLRRF